MSLIERENIFNGDPRELRDRLLGGYKRGGSLRDLGEKLYGIFRNPAFSSLNPENQQAIRLFLEAATTPEERGILAATMMCRWSSSNKAVAKAREMTGLFTEKLDGWCLPFPGSPDNKIPCRVWTREHLAGCKKFVTHQGRGLSRRSREKVLFKSTG